MIPNPRVAVYVRVSTREQNTASQEDTLRDYCARQGWERDTWYRESASGANVARTKLGQLMTDVRHGRVDVVLVYKLDRFGRSTAHMLQLMEELKERRVIFISATEPINTGGTSGQLLFEIMAAIASHERVITLERSAAGLAAARARGAQVGRPAKFAARVALAIKLARTIKNRSALARRCKLSRSYVSKILKAEEIRKAAAAGKP